MFAVSFVAVVILPLVFSDSAYAQSGVKMVAHQPDDIDWILNALVIRPLRPRMTNDALRALYKQQFTDMAKAETRLRELGTNTLPLLMDRVHAAGSLSKSNRDAGMQAAMRLGLAFEILGDTARPLLPQLIEEFRSGRSVWASVVGIKHIGGTEAGLTLVAGLTNSDLIIRDVALSSMSLFATNREVVEAAIPLLISLLQDKSEFTRALASSALGSMPSKPEFVVPALLQVAEIDSDFVVRCQAAKAIGRFGTNASFARDRLERIASQDAEAITRRAAKVAMESVTVPAR